MKQGLLAFLVMCVVVAKAQYSTSEILVSLHRLTVAGSALYVAAHPDDENTEFLAWLANEKKFQTAYLSITRGDGGQNLIGKEQREKLGLIRTQELLAARRVDGAKQFFTRANDFGYSKNPEETFRIWNKDSILADMVWVIRQTRPDVIFCRFPTDGSGGHGHHTASAILAEEAFDRAADPQFCVQQLAYVQPWKTSRIYFNAFEWNRTPGQKQPGEIRIDVGVFNKITGKSYSEIAAESRSMHKSQGFGSAKWRGHSYEYFRPLKGNTDTTGLFNTLNVSITRVGGSKQYQTLVAQAIASFNSYVPQNTIPLLIKAHNATYSFDDTFWAEVKRKELESLLIACLGAHVEASAKSYTSIPGGSVILDYTAVIRNAFPVVLTKVRTTFITDTIINAPIVENDVLSLQRTVQIPALAVITNPYWLAQPATNPGFFNVTNQQLIGKAYQEAVLQAQFELSLPGLAFTVTKDILHKWVEPSDGEKYRDFLIIPPVYVQLKQDKILFTNELQSKSISVTVVCNTSSVAGTLQIIAPTGWVVDQKEIPFKIKTKGAQQDFTIQVRAGTTAKSGSLQVIAQVGQPYSYSLATITYPHIPIQTLQIPVKAQLIAAQIQTKAKNIGYIQGAGDDVAQCLELMGCKVTLLDDVYLTNNTLGGFDAIVLGIRAYNVQERLAVHYPKIMAYVKQGGIVVAQYNTANWIQSPKADMGPYMLKIGRDRVTDENATVSFLVPEHPLLNTPNKINAADFDGWVQERGLYFASSYDSSYKAILEMADPNEKPYKGSLIACRYGNGMYIYSGLSFFRQLPAGVPGAYRLFANLISGGKK